MDKERLHLSGENRKPFFPRQEHWTSSVIPLWCCVLGLGKKNPDVMNIVSRWSIRLPTFSLRSVSYSFTCVSVTVNPRVYRTDRGSSLIRAWSLWFAGPEREAAWRYNTVSSALKWVHSAVAHQRSCFIVDSEQLWERDSVRQVVKWKFKSPNPLKNAHSHGCLCFCMCRVWNQKPVFTFICWRGECLCAHLCT